MLSQAISLRRLRFYEQECRRYGATLPDNATRSELGKFEESFRRAALELQAAQERSQPHTPPETAQF